MRIGLYNGSTLYPLAGEDGVSERVHSSAADVVIQPSAALQVVEKVRAANALHLDRGNLAHSISFTTTRKFDSVDLAELWALDYDADFPRTGTLYLDTLTPGGFILRRQMADAVVSPPQRRLNGAMISLTYTVQGGAISGGTEYPDIEVTGTLTSNGTTPVTFPILQFAGFFDGKPVYSDNGLTTGHTHILYWYVSAWLLIQISPSCGWNSSSAVATPDLASGWTPLGIATGTPVVAEA